MTDLISREKLKDDIAVLLERNGKLIDEWLANCIDDVIDEQPTIEAEPVKHGRWIVKPLYKGATASAYVCSVCGEPFWWTAKYCMNCGSKMDEVEE